MCRVGARLQYHDKEISACYRPAITVLTILFLIYNLTVSQIKSSFFYQKEITAAISSSIYQHQCSRLSSSNKALGCKEMDNEATGFTFIGRFITSSIPLRCSLSHNNNSLFVSATSTTPELLTTPLPKLRMILFIKQHDKVFLKNSHSRS